MELTSQYKQIIKKNYKSFLINMKNDTKMFLTSSTGTNLMKLTYCELTYTLGISNLKTTFMGKT